MIAEPILAAYGITHSYGGDDVLRAVSLEVFRSEIIALIGPNGCGKSTFLKILAGLLPLNGADCGQVRYRAQDFLRLSAAEKAQRVAYVSPHLRADFPLSAYEAVMMGRTCHASGLFRKTFRSDQDAVHAAMEQCHCWGLRERDLHTLSGGERQLVAMARALAQGARVLLLDEALSGMDLNHQAEIGKLLKKLAADGFAFILVSHDVNLAAEWADTCLMLRKGERVAYGPAKEVIDTARIRTLYPGVDLFVGSHPTTGAPKIFFGKEK